MDIIIFKSKMYDITYMYKTRYVAVDSSIIYTDSEEGHKLWSQYEYTSNTLRHLRWNRCYISICRWEISCHESHFTLISNGKNFPLCKIDFLPLACSFARYSFDIFFFLEFPLFYKKNMNVSWGREILSDYSWHCMFSPQA